MERFKIYLYSKVIGNTTDGRVIITDSEKISEASTFNENFSIQENDRISFNFDIYEKLHNGEKNPFIEHLVPEAVLGLEFPDRATNTASPQYEGAYYKLKIIERSPSFNEDNTLYSVSSIDFANAVYSKQAEGLSIEKTGSLRTIAEEILGETRKNTLYKDLNTNYAKLYLEKNWLEVLKDNNIEYSLPYINYDTSGMAYFNSGAIAKLFVTDKFIDGESYDVQFDVISSTVTQGSNILPVDFSVGVVGKTLEGQTSFSDVDGFVVNFDKPVTIRSEFTFVNNSLDPTDHLEIQLFPIQDVSVGDPWPQTGAVKLSIANIQITKSRSRTNNRQEGNTGLIINHLDNFKDFQLPEKGKNIDKKMTFSISNSNLYNALISLAALFEAEVKFDYIENAIYFVSKKHRTFKGYNLDPRINLKSLSRPESSSSFATILHVEGSGDVEGAIPPLPKEWRRFLSQCVDNEFEVKTESGIITDYFSDYSLTSYTDNIDRVAQYIDENDSEVERMYEIRKFAEHMDQIPNFESTLYDFSYFEEIGLLEDKFPFIVDLIYNTTRKINIALNINTFRYYQTYSDFLTQLQQVSFYTSLINTEEKFMHNTQSKLEGNDAPKKYTNSWVGYMNAIDAATANIASFTEELYDVVGLNQDGRAKEGFLEPGSFVYNACMLFGYEDKKNNGVQDLILENEEKIREKSQEKEELLNKIEELETRMDEETQYIKESISVELAGYRSRIENINNYIGKGSLTTNNFRGSYHIESALYRKLAEVMGDNVVGIPNFLINNQTSLFKLLFDRESPHNLIIKKEKELETLMDEYEAFALEARYQNNDEVTAEGLLEQGLLTFIKINRPKVSYNILAIHIGALEDYSFYSHPEVGDRIRVGGNLYLSYDKEETEDLIIVGFSENLRSLDSLSLQVEKDDESELLVRRMLEQTNFIQMNKGKAASKRLVPIPRELSWSIDSVEESLDTLYNTNLSIINLFDEMK